MDYRKYLSEARDCFMVFMSTALYAIGLVLFFLPYHLTSGGVSGVSTIIFYATGIEVQVSYAIINVMLLAVGLYILGWRFCVKTIVGVVGCTFWIWFFQRAFEDASGQLPMLVGDERFMAVILGAILEGFALALCFHNNGSTGGTDIIAACVNKYKDVSLGQMILSCDILIISSCYFIFDDIPMVIFGYVMMAVASMTLDYLTRMLHQAVEFKIFSRNYQAIAAAIHDAGFGVTVLDGTGWHTLTERKVVTCIASKRYSPTIARAIKRVDPYAFVSVTNVQAVYGEGFETMKAKVKDQKPILVFATNNKHKLEEVRNIVGDRFEIRSLSDIGCNVDIPETANTFEGNALQKAKFIKQFYGFDCFADDTGLEVNALNGEPGIYSARYASLDGDAQSHDSEANMQKLLQKLDGVTDRRAQFRTAIALVKGDEEHVFEGVVHGTITTEKAGSAGFGYDPVFVPEGHDKTFAELGEDIKNQISHRARATQQLSDYLATLK